MSNQTSPVVRLGQETEAALLLVGEELVQVAALAAAAELERGLEAHPLVRLGVGAVGRSPLPATPGRSPSCASVPTPPSMSVSACARRDPCDEAEVVVLDAPLRGT